MSTAIVSTYTTEGFVIAADGRMRGADDGTVVNDQIQKIFPIGGSGTRRLAFSLTGSAYIPSCDREEMAFEFLAEIRRATGALSVGRYPNLSDYAHKAFGAVHRRLKEAKLTGRLSYPELQTLDPSERGCSIAIVLLDGYHEGVPSRLKIRFYHEHQVLAGLEIVQQELPPGRAWYSGSETVWDVMFGAHVDTGDPALSHYKQQSASVFHPNETLCSYAQIAHAYISMCPGPEGLALDPELCAGIGGHIHIATITPKDGFQWVPRFEPRPE
jgi:hypothetical protein